MKVLVTGAAGFICGYLVEDLLAGGHDVIGLDNFSKYGEVAQASRQNPRYRFVQGDAKDTALLKELLEHVTRPEFCYRHEWQEGDLVIWDNRCVLHRGTPYDTTRYKRLLQRTTISGDPAEPAPANDHDVMTTR